MGYQGQSLPNVHVLPSVRDPRIADAMQSAGHPILGEHVSGFFAATYSYSNPVTPASRAEQPGSGWLLSKGTGASSTPPEPLVKS